MGQPESFRVAHVHISDPVVYHGLSPSDAQLSPFIFPQQQKQQCDKMKKRAFLSRGRACYPFLAGSYSACCRGCQWDGLCRISMTRTHWVCTGRAHGPPSQKGWEQSLSSTLHHTTKAFCRLIWMIMGPKAERAPCPSTISCWDGFVAMSCTSMGALNSAIARQN